MASVPVGSIVEWVSGIVPDIPTSLSSGTTIQKMIERKIILCENYTGESIGGTVANKWQQIVTDFGAASVLNSMELLEADVSSVKLGEFSVNKGGKSNATKSKDFYEAQAWEGLKLIGRQASFKKTFS